MNIVDLIKEQLSGELLGKLGSALGQDQATTSKAATAAVPSLLSILAGLASSPGGVEKLLSALKNFDANSLGSVLSSLRSGKVNEVQAKGNDALGSLLGAGAVSTVAGALSKFTGIEASSIKGLLSTIFPLVLGVISSHFKGKPLNASALSSFFAEQKANINAAMPAGLSLGSIPGLGGALSAPSAAGTPSWLLPVGVIALLLAIGAWWYYGQQPTEPAVKPADSKQSNIAADPKPKIVPETPNVVGDLTKLYTTATETLTQVKDVPSAQAAAPELEGLVGTLDSLKPLLDKLPEAAKTALSTLQSKNLGPLKELVTKVLAIPGVSEKLKPILDALIAKLSEIK